MYGQQFGESVGGAMGAVKAALNLPGGSLAESVMQVKAEGTCPSAMRGLCGLRMEEAWRPEASPSGLQIADLKLQI